MEGNVLTGPQGTFQLIHTSNVYTLPTVPYVPSGTNIAQWLCIFISAHIEELQFLDPPVC